MFLDRVGDPGDVPLIESLGVRLLAGQCDNGGWSYHCPSVDQGEVNRLRTLLKQRQEIKTAAELPKGGPRRTVRDLAPEIQAQLKRIDELAAKGAQVAAADDNSNTQFAVLALWIARRHGLPVERALQRIDARFRSSQFQDGSWAYMHGIGGGPFATGSPAMTCAGLLGLALLHGAINDDRGQAVRDPAKDRSINAGLLYLGAVIDHPLAKKPPGTKVPILDESPLGYGKVLYFLWSLERVAMIYGLKTIGEKDWYTWGAEVLVANQKADGGWFGYGGRTANTAFALLFLKRSNLAQDLTTSLRNRVKDPGVMTLRGGGIGGAELQAGIKRPRPAIDPDAKKAADASAGSDDEAVRLAADLTQANGAKQTELIGKYKETKGVVYSEALALAIPKLAAEPRSSAREALAERLTRMNSATLGDKLADANGEIRRAAALACAMKEDKAHLARLIELLQDGEQPVTRAAYVALKSLTNQDFGPARDASREERDKAVLAWKKWLKSQGP
jgi:hypothetical protein